MRSCYSLFQNLLDVVSRDSSTKGQWLNETTVDPDDEYFMTNGERVLLNPSFRLPSDLHKPHEVPLIETLEEMAHKLLMDKKMIKNSFLNSMTSYDILTQ